MQVETYFKTKSVRLKGTPLHKLYVSVFLTDNYQCQNPRCCGGSPIDKAPHHIKYKSQGGADEAGNLVTLCRACHDRIHNRGTLKIELSWIDEERQLKFIEK